MYFTQEDFKKIEKWLLQSTVKDTQFADAATPLKGNETIAFVQGNQNVKTTIKDFVDQLFLLGVADFLNVLINMERNISLQNRLSSSFPQGVERQDRLSLSWILMVIG